MSAGLRAREPFTEDMARDGDRRVDDLIQVSFPASCASANLTNGHEQAWAIRTRTKHGDAAAAPMSEVFRSGPTGNVAIAPFRPLSPYVVTRLQITLVGGHAA